LGSSEEDPRIAVIRPRADSGEVRLRSWVIDSDGNTLTPNSSVTGMEIWRDLELQVVVLTVMDTPEGSAFKFDYLPKHRFLGYPYLPEGSASSKQRSTICETLREWGLELEMDAQMAQRVNQVLMKYVSF
jgi:hypothetical protein